MGMTEWRNRVRAFGRRRLLRLRDRIDGRVERLDRKKAALRETAAEAEPSRPSRRPASRRSRPAPQAPANEA